MDPRCPDKHLFEVDTKRGTSSAKMISNGGVITDEVLRPPPELLPQISSNDARRRVSEISVSIILKSIMTVY